MVQNPQKNRQGRSHRYHLHRVPGCLWYRESTKGGDLNWDDDDYYCYCCYYYDYYYCYYYDDYAYNDCYYDDQPWNEGAAFCITSNMGMEHPPEMVGSSSHPVMQSSSGLVPCCFNVIPQVRMTMTRINEREITGRCESHYLRCCCWIVTFLNENVSRGDVRGHHHLVLHDQVIIGLQQQPGLWNYRSFIGTCGLTPPASTDMGFSPSRFAKHHGGKFLMRLSVWLRQPQCWLANPPFLMGRKGNMVYR